MVEHVDSEQTRRLWEFRLHLNGNFYNRLNFFLVFESVLLGVVGLLYSKPQPPVLVVKMMILLGLSLTVIWGYIQARQKYLLDDLDAHVKAVAPEYEAFLERRKRSRWPVSSKWLLTYVVPALIAFVWLVLLFFL